MKTTLIYGLGAALVMAVWTLAEFFLGWHGDHIELGMRFGFLKLVVPILLVVFVIRAVRAESPGGGLTFGKGVGSAVLTSLWYGIASAVFAVAYALAINPGFVDAMINYQMGELAKKGLPSQALEGAEKMMHIMMNPGIQAGINVLGAVFWGAIVGLIAAAILKREPQTGDVPPPVVS